MNGEKNSSPVKERYIIIMRHGERSDLVEFNQSCNIMDPELTEEGKNQAHEAGNRLKQILEAKFAEETYEYKSDAKKIVLLSSPFTRTLQTAKYIKNGMGLNIPIYIENGLSEFISKNWFRNSPSEFLSYYKLLNLDNDNMGKSNKLENSQKEYFLKEFMCDVIINQSITRLPEYPESTNKCITRFQNTLDSVMLYYLHRKNFDVMILVTHYFGIQVLCDKLEIPVDYYDVEYASTFIFKYNETTEKYKFISFFYPA